MTMNKKDKQAFKEWYKQQIWGNASWEDGVFEGFEFGLEHARNKQAEPVAWRLNHGNGFFSEFITGMPTEVAKVHWKRMGVMIEYAYLHPAPAVAPADVVRELVEVNQLLKLAIEWALEWDTDRNFVMPYKVRDPMRAALKSAKEHGL